MENHEPSKSGPLSGLRVIEFASIGPGPHCAMLLSDMGAEVVRINRAGGNGWANPIVDRGRAILEVDIRNSEGRDLCLSALEKVDVSIEGFRPGVMERLGLGPDIALDRNPRLVYGRVTGWGQEGPLAQSAGHDINYIALTGALAAIGSKDTPPIPPLNLLGDFGGGSMFLAFGIMAALWERERSGLGQVVDAAIIDGVASMMTMFAGLLSSGKISMKRGSNMLGGGAPFYRCYTCADGLDISVGPIEKHFYAALIKLIDAPNEFIEQQMLNLNWDMQSELLASIFATKSRAVWCELLEGTDVCFAPVLTLEESYLHPHHQARQTYIKQDDIVQAMPAPRFSRTPGQIGKSGDGLRRLREWGVNSISV